MEKIKVYIGYYEDGQYPYYAELDEYEDYCYSIEIDKELFERIDRNQKEYQELQEILEKLYEQQCVVEKQYRIKEKILKLEKELKELKEQNK